MDILIALDAEPHSQLCLDLVLSLFALSGLRLTLLHVIAPPDPALLLADRTGRLEQAYPQASRQITGRLLDQVTGSLRDAGAETSVQVVEGDPAARILSIVESQGVKAIVIAPGSHTPQEKMLHDTMTSRLLRHDLQAALILARRGAGGDKPPPVVMAVDGSPASSEALRLFAGLLAPAVPVVLLSCPPGADQAAVERPLEEAAALLAGLGRKSRSVTSKEPLAAWVSGQMEKQPPGLLVLSRTVGEFLHRPLTGSPTEKLFLAGPCSTALYCARAKL